MGHTHPLAFHHEQARRAPRRQRLPTRETPVSIEFLVATGSVGPRIGRIRSFSDENTGGHGDAGSRVPVPPDDAEFRTALQNQFGDKAILAEVKSYDGIECFQAIVKIVQPLAPFVVAFLVGYLRERKRRIVLTPGGEIRLENYSVDEAKDLLIRLATGAAEE